MNALKRIADPSRRPNLYWGLISALYFVFVTVSHEWVTEIYSQVFNHFGRAAMESTLHVGSLALAVLMAGVCLFMFRRTHSINIRILILWVSMSLLIFAVDRLLVVTNIERIHYPQYAILALLLRMALADDFLVAFLATLAGMLDEFMQFVWNPQYTKYVDFNDFVLNALGAVAGVTLFLTLSSRARSAIIVLRKTRMFAYIMTGAVLGLCSLGVWMGRIIVYVAPQEDFHVLTRIGGKLAFVLSFMNNPDFWTVSEYGRRYHILSPLEGLVVLTLLLAVYKYLLPGADKLEASESFA